MSQLIVATSPYLQQPLRPLRQAQLDLARQTGRLALHSWHRTLYINCIEGHVTRESGRPLLFLDDYDSLHVAAIAAATGYGKRPGHYRLTICLTPEKIEPLHLTELGDFLAARIPQAGPGES